MNHTLTDEQYEAIVKEIDERNELINNLQSNIQQQVQFIQQLKELIREINFVLQHEGNVSISHYKADFFDFSLIEAIIK